MLTTNTLHFDSLTKAAITEYDEIVEYKATFLFKSQEGDEATLALNNDVDSTTFTVGAITSTHSGDKAVHNTTVDAEDALAALEKAVAILSIPIAGNELVKARLTFVSTIGYLIERT